MKKDKWKKIPESVRKMLDVEYWTVISPESEREFEAMLASDECCEPSPEDLEAPEDTELPDNDSPLYCSAEWHIAQFSYARLAFPLYNTMSRVAHESGRFGFSLPQMARYFKTTPNNIRHAKDALVAAGFIAVRSELEGKSKVYAPISHEQWAKSHPGKCCQKLDQVWTGEGDPLARALAAACDWREKTFFKNVLIGYRKTGFTDERILTLCKELVEQEDKNKVPRKGFAGRLARRIRVLAAAESGSLEKI
jgi:hypothetical protein